LAVVELPERKARQLFTKNVVAESFLVRCSNLIQVNLVELVEGYTVTFHFAQVALEGVQKLRQVLGVKRHRECIHLWVFAVEFCKLLVADAVGLMVLKERWRRGGYCTYLKSIKEFS